VTFLVAGLASSSNTSSTISNVEPGLLGFLVVAALGIALVFLLRSMTKHLRKIGPKPEEAGPAGPQSAAAAASGEPQDANRP
jgi:hypothetical protein